MVLSGIGWVDSAMSLRDTGGSSGRLSQEAVGHPSVDHLKYRGGRPVAWVVVWVEYLLGVLRLV